jgi:peptidoglycan/xylan/chitin deacetylase (PgdA/CDA1 family)
MSENGDISSIHTAMLRSGYRLGSKLIAKTKIPQLFHSLAYQDELTVIMYHGIIKDPLMVNDWCFVDEHSFRTQILYLKKHFEIISLSEAVERMRSGGIKRPTAVITFDDGYQNNFDVAFPILLRERIPATIFLTTGLINTNDTVWYCRFNIALSQTRRPHIELSGFKFDLSTLNLKAKASVAIQESLKKLEHSQLMKTMRHIILQLDEDPDYLIETDSPFRMLDETAIVEMVGSGLIEFGAHTHHHAILSQLLDKERYNEIRQSIDTVYELTGRPCRYFAYPNGRAEDYNIETIRDLETCGIQIGVTTISGPNNRMTPAMELRRYGIGAHLPMSEFQLMVHHFITKIRGRSDKKAVVALNNA